ncbi:MAG TPA: sulfatase, partial [Isosphaeraceae bacterium]
MMTSLPIVRTIAAALALAPVAAAGVPSPSPAAAAPRRPNVLFIAIDDLNDWVGHLGGHPQARTPNIDRLAQRGVTFTRAHCAAPLCNPSRAALLSGLRPSDTGVYRNETDWREAVPRDAVTLPLHFKRNGYDVAGAGKIDHESFRRDSDWDDYATPKEEGRDPRPGGDTGVGGIQFAPLEARDEDLRDYRVVSWVIDKLHGPHEKPFFLACGLHKPHMPWNVPRNYFDLFPLDQIVLPRVLETDLDDVPAAGVRMAAPQGDHRRILESGRWKEAVQGYLAAGAFADAMVGRLLEALDKSPHRDDTIVVLWGDHGWHLGEKLHWRKFTLWEEATRAPLIFVVPGVTRAGGVCARTVDFMSLYPTLADLCGLPVPGHVHGPSLRPLLADPGAPWDRPALTTYLVGNHAVRSEGWRYIRYRDGSEELYDEAADPLEWTNLAARPELAAVKAELARWLPQANAPDPGPGARAPNDARPAAKRAARRAQRAARPLP